MKKPLISLFTPGSRMDLVRKSAKYEPDAIVIDLEDAVPIDLKAKARTEVAETLPELSVPVLVRVNNELDLLEKDLEAVVGPHVHGVILAMADDVGQVCEVDRIMGRLEEARGLAPNGVKLLLSIETALGVMRCFDLIEAARDRVETVVFGSAEDGDLQRDLQCTWSIEGVELLYARSKVLLEARAARLPYVLDGAFGGVTDLEALRADCLLSRRLGYSGRTVIHPSHVAVAREVYRPSEKEVEYYTRMISAFEDAERRGLAAITFEGKLVDYAMYKKARTFLAA